MPLLFSDDLCCAFTAAVVRSFQEQEPSGYLGRTALQKLVYFSRSIGVPIPCTFEIYNYGPYSEDITKAVSRLLGDEVIEDTAPAWARYSSYKLGPSAEDFSASIMQSVLPYRSKIDTIVAGLGKLPPAKLELIATLHFVNGRLKGYLGAVPAKSEVVTEFRNVKGDKFETGDIDEWYGWLSKTSLI